ncbi:MAG: energy transducer TonB [Myxococcota bacterium]
MSPMRLFVALLFGVGVTLVQLAALGALNSASTPEESEVTEAQKPLMLMVAETPRAQARLRRVPTSVRSQVSTPQASAAHIRASALPTLGDMPARSDLTGVLPGLGGIGLGSVDVPEVASEPDRPARARRTPEPVYPVTAQRDGVEGYVIVRLSVDAQGRVNDVVVVDSEPIGVFERSAREAARRFAFHPAQVDGVPASATLEKKIVFRLK